MLQDHFTGTEIASRIRNASATIDYSPITTRKFSRLAHIETSRIRISCFADPRKKIRGKIWVNISGNRYQLTTERLSKYPNSLLSDEIARAAYYDLENDEFFFDRNRRAFECIYHFYQTNGVLFWPEDFPTQVLIKELKFYGLYDSVDKEVKESLEPPFKKPKAIGTVTKTTKLYKLQSSLCQVFEEPDSSITARIWGFLSSFATLVSIIVTCFHPFPTYLGKNHSSLVYQNLTQANLKEIKNQELLQPASFGLFVVESICFGLFTLEYLLRFIASPRKCKFMLDILNWLDLIAIIPFYVGLAFSTSVLPVPSFACLRVFHLSKFFRVFNQKKLYYGARVMGLTIKTSLSDLATLMFLVLVATVLFSSFIFYFENWDSEKNTEGHDFESIPASFWWALITLTTVGYGDMVPKTLGKC